MTVTSDLSEFGSRKLKMAAKLLTALTSHGSNGYLGDKVQVLMNTYSGFVFLSDEDYNVMMMNGDNLEPFYSCAECGNEGFAEDTDWNQEHHLCGTCATEIIKEEHLS